MERLENSKYLSVTILGLFFILMVFNVFTVTKLPIQDIAFTTMAWTQYLAVFILGFYVQKRKGFDARTASFTVGLILFACVYVLVYFLGNRTLDTSEELSGFLLMLAFVFGMAQIHWRTEHIKVFALMGTGLIAIFLLQWMHQGFPTFQFQSSIRNPNIFGALVATLLYFPFVVFSTSSIGKRLLLGIGILIGFFLIVVSSTRAALLLVFIALIAKIVSMFSRKLFNMLFYIVMLFNAGFILIYSWLYKSQVLTSFNDWFLEYFGKQFFSGRQEIWGAAIQYGLEAPFLGHFIGVKPTDYIADTSLVHAHNQYLQVFLEGGIMALAGFVFLLYTIWRTYQRHLNSEIVTWSACFFLGILLYQSLEISLFGNIEGVGLFQWLIIAIGLGACTKGESRRETFSY